MTTWTPTPEQIAELCKILSCVDASSDEQAQAADLIEALAAQLAEQEDGYDAELADLALREATAIQRAEQAEAAAASAWEDKDQAYLERNHLVAMLARLYPSGIRATNIPGWSPDWHGCVYIDLPSGQISYHYHDSHSYLFADLPPYTKEWDGHDKNTVHARLKSTPAPVTPSATAGSSAEICDTIAAEPPATPDGRHDDWQHGWQDGAMACAAEIRARAPAPAEADGWRPIETAPRDGTHVMVPSQFTGMEIDEAVYDHTAPDGGGWWSVKLEITIEPTLWRPLPSPPTAREGNKRPSSQGDEPT